MLDASTLFGGSASETGTAVAVDYANRIELVGSTTSTNLPLVNALQSGLGTATQDAFLARFDSLGLAPTFATYEGGNNSSTANGVAVDGLGEALVVGATSATNFPTVNATQGTLGGGAQDIFVTRYAADDSALNFSTYYGSSGSGTGYAAAVDPLGNLYAGGTTGTYGVVLKYGPSVQAPTIGGFTTDTGYSSTDNLTYDTTPQFYGTGATGATISVYLQSAAAATATLEGTTTVAGGLWTYTLSAPGSDGVYAVTATQTVSGTTSGSSVPYTFTLDTTAPAVTLSVVSQTYDTKPEVDVVFSDLNGFAPTTTVVLDESANGTTWTSNYATATITNSTVMPEGYAAFTAYTALTAGTMTYFRARVLDAAGNQGTSATESVSVLAAATVTADLTPQVRSNYGGMSAWGADGLDAAGDVTASQTLGLDQSPTPVRGTSPMLVYNSQEANPVPSVQFLVELPAADGAPTGAVGTLTWDGSVVGTYAYNVSALSAGAPWIFAGQGPTSSATGRHTYSLAVALTFSNSSYNTMVSDTGDTYVVNRSSSPYGAGWSFSDTDTLVTISASGSYPAGLLREFGGGGWAFYPSNGSGGYTSPAGDGGTLAVSGSGWTYTAWDGEVLTFNASGQETSWVGPTGYDAVTYAYTGTSATSGVSTVSSSDGGLSTFNYSSGLLSTIQAPGSRTTTFTLSSTNLTSITDAAGGVHSFGYNGSHDLTSDTYGVLSTSYSYSNSLVQTVQLGGEGVTTITAADAAGLGTAAKALDGAPGGSEVDGLGNLSRGWYNPFGQPVETIAPDGAVNDYDRNAAGWVTESVDPLGYTTTFAVNGNGQITGETHPDSSTEGWTFDASKDYALTSYTDPNGNTTTYTNNSAGQVLTRTDALSAVTTSAYYATGAAAGLLSTVTDPDGNLTSYSYDADRRMTGSVTGGVVNGTTGYDSAGNPNTFTDALGNVTTTGHDGVGRATLVTDPMGNTNATNFTADGSVLSTTDGDGHTTSYAYTGAGLQTTEIDAYGTGIAETVRSAYDAVGNQTGTADALGNWSYSAYDSVGEVISSTDARGFTTKNQYDLDGDLTAVIDPLGRLTKYGFNVMNEQTTVTDALGGVSTTLYDKDENTTETIDALGRTTQTVYDKDDRAIEQIDGANDITSTVYDKASNPIETITPLGEISTQVYDARERVIENIDARGFIATMQYNADDEVTETIDAAGDVATMAYNKDGEVTSSTDALGRTAASFYDADRNVTATEDALGKYTTTAFDALNRATAVTDALNHTTTSIFNADNEMVQAIDPLGNATFSAYNADGEEVGTVDAKGNATASVFDGDGNLVKSVDAQGDVTTNVVDALNRGVETIDALGRTTQSIFNAASDVIATVDGAGDRTSYGYDSADRRSSVTDALNHTITSAYNGDSEVTKTTDALGHVTSYAFDSAGNQTLLTDPDGNTTTWAYDVLERPVGETTPTGGHTSQAYNGVGDVTSATDADGRRIGYSYDSDDRMTGETWFSAAGATVQLETWTFDAAGNTLTAQAAAGAYTFSYDADNRVSTVQEPFGLALTFGYDVVGNRTLVQDSLGGTTTVTFNALNEQTAEQMSGTGITTVLDNRTYTAEGLLSTETRQTFVSGAWVTSSTTSYGYDASERTTAITDFASGGAVLASFVYSFDADNRVVSETNDGVLRTFGYDADSELTSDGGTLYSYDANGNRNMTGYVVGTNNEVTTDGTSTFTYDAAGNQIQSTVGASGATWVFAYNNMNEMVGASYSATLGGTVTTQVTLVYDAYGNLIEEDTWVSGTGMTVTRYGLDGWNPNQPAPLGNENFNDWVDLSGSNALVDRRMFGPGVAQPVVREDASGNVGWYLADELGNVRALVNGSGTVLTALTYDGWGSVLSNSTPAQSDRYLKAGSQWDSTLGQWRSGGRTQNADGSWDEQDETGFGAGDTNLDRLVGNDPTNVIDPSGLMGEPPPKPPSQGRPAAPEIGYIRRYNYSGDLGIDKYLVKSAVILPDANGLTAQLQITAAQVSFFGTEKRAEQYVAKELQNGINQILDTIATFEAKVTSLGEEIDALKQAQKEIQKKIDGISKAADTIALVTGAVGTASWFVPHPLFWATGGVIVVGGFLAGGVLVFARQAYKKQIAKISDQIDAKEREIKQVKEDIKVWNTSLAEWRRESKGGTWTAFAVKDPETKVTGYKYSDTDVVLHFTITKEQTADLMTGGTVNLAKVSAFLKTRRPVVSVDDLKNLKKEP